MNADRLRIYRCEKEEIKELKHKLEHIADDDKMVGNDVVYDYRSGFPKPQSIVGVDKERLEKKRARMRRKIRELEDRCSETEEWVDEITDSMTRRIFRLKYIDGMTQQQISRRVHISQSRVSERIKDYLKTDKKE